jgi:hypothetical protein
MLDMDRNVQTRKRNVQFDLTKYISLFFCQVQKRENFITKWNYFALSQHLLIK